MKKPSAKQPAKGPAPRAQKAKAPSSAPVKTTAPPPPRPPDPTRALVIAAADRLLSEGSVGALAEMLGLDPRVFAEAIVQLALNPDADPPRLTPLGKAPLTPPQLTAVMQKAVAELRNTEDFLGARKKVLQSTQRKAGDPRVADVTLEAELSKKIRFGSRGM